MTATLELAEQLIARASVTPADAGCQELIAKRLQAIGFHCETIVSGPIGFSVTNLWAKRAVAPRKYCFSSYLFNSKRNKDKNTGICRSHGCGAHRPGWRKGQRALYAKRA